MTAQKRNFIVIDDNKLDCFIAEKIITNTVVGAQVSVYMDAREALEMIKNGTLYEGLTKTLILVDIQMPLMNGFEFVESFERLPHETKNNYSIVMLSSSINPSDLNRVGNYPSVKHFLNKPLSMLKLSSIIDGENN